MQSTICRAEQCSCVVPIGMPYRAGADRWVLHLGGNARRLGPYAHVLAAVWLLAQVLWAHPVVAPSLDMAHLCPSALCSSA